MNSPVSFATLEPSLEPFDLVSFGQLPVSPDHVRLGFQLDVIPPTGMTELVFGLIAPTESQAADPCHYGLAVRIDLMRGEVWDLSNGSGLIGWVDHPLGMAGYSEEDPLLLSWEVEHLGSALLPKLQIGGEEWLYPAVRCPEQPILEAIAGCTHQAAQLEEIFLHPALWSEQPQ